MQSIVIKGNLTRDPELNNTSSGVAVVNFTVAESRKFTRKDGTKDEETTFINCEAWEKTANLIDQLMSMGDPIIVQGTLKTDKWEKDGVKHERLKLRVTTFDKLYRKSSNEDSTEATSEPVAVAAATGDDIPF